MPDTLRSPWLRPLVYGHGWLALGAAAQVWYTGRLVGAVAPDPTVITSAALATLAAYGFMRLVRVGDAAAASDHLVWAQRHRRVLMALTLVSGALSAWLLWYHSREALPLALLMAPAVGLYILPTREGRNKGLRHVPFLKLFLIAAVWSGVVVAFPLVARGLGNSPLLFLLLVERAFFVLAITLPFDIRDLHHDEPDQRTVPRALGIGPTRVLALLALLGSLVIVALVCLTQGLLDGLFGALLAYVITGWLVLRSRPRSGAFHYSVLLDGTLLLVPLLFALGLLLG